MSLLMVNVTYPLSVLWETLFDYLELRVAERQQRRVALTADDAKASARRASGEWRPVAVH